MPTAQHRHRVVVIGAGFGGLRVARGLRDAPVDVTIVDANNFHTFQPLLYQVATAGLDTDDIAYPVRGIFRRQRNVSVRMATVTAVDLAARRVETDRGTPLEYDALVVAAGTVSHDFGIPGVAEHAHPLKTAGDAVALRNHLLARFEEAALNGDTGATARSTSSCAAAGRPVWRWPAGSPSCTSGCSPRTSRGSTSPARTSRSSRPPTACSAPFHAVARRASQEHARPSAASRWSRRCRSSTSSRARCTSPRAACSPRGPWCGRPACAPTRSPSCSEWSWAAVAGSSCSPT